MKNEMESSGPGQTLLMVGEAAEPTKTTMRFRGGTKTRVVLYFC